MKRLTVKIDDGNYIPRALCSIGRDGEIDDHDGCADYCEFQCEQECGECAIQHCYNRLAAYENMHERIIKRIEEIQVIIRITLLARWLRIWNGFSVKLIKL